MECEFIDKCEYRADCVYSGFLKNLRDSFKDYAKVRCKGIEGFPGRFEVSYQERSYVIDLMFMMAGPMDSISIEHIPILNKIFEDVKKDTKIMNYVKRYVKSKKY